MSGAGSALLWGTPPAALPGADLDGDLAFQSSVAGYNFVEEDFDSYPQAPIGPTLTYGNVNATLSFTDTFFDVSPST